MKEKKPWRMGAARVTVDERAEFWRILARLESIERQLEALETELRTYRDCKPSAPRR